MHVFTASGNCHSHNKRWLCEPGFRPSAFDNATVTMSNGGLESFSDLRLLHLLDERWGGGL